MLGEQLALRSSAVAWLRLLAATVVVLFHSFALNRLWARDPLGMLMPGTDLGQFGVQIFFFLSGLLVAQSYARHASIAKFALARVLRLYPALVAATLFTIALAAWSSALPLETFLLHHDTLVYALQRASGLVANDALPGAFATNPLPLVNGSLWTLPIEIKMYIGVAGAGLLGLLTRKWLLAAVVAACAVLITIYPQSFPITPDFRGTRLIVLMFALGALCFAWREHIPLSIPAALVGVALLYVFPAARAHVVVYSLLTSYLVLTIGYNPRLQNALPPLATDLSYGIYVYSFPVQQTLIEHWGGSFAGNPWLLFPAAMCIVAPIAALSWFGLEKPFLRLKIR